MRPFKQSSGLRCDGLTRRHFLHLGMLTSLGVSLADVLRWQGQARETATRDRRGNSCILIWLDGGPSHLDTFDPKPDAPSEVRSLFKSISTAVPGLHISEHL